MLHSPDGDGLSLWKACGRWLTLDVARRILALPAVQELLRTEKMQHLLSGILDLNSSDRGYIKNAPKNSNRGIKVAATVSKNLDVLLIHLRENPTLCGISRQNKRTLQESETAQEMEPPTKRQRKGRNER